ncbi:hypothetical protein DDQ41_06840 [Streptomyces spongiicola]|uniref:Transcriptional regulator, AbiEi antitoxin, Type IV TA system n=1 Tax=Streptomyces spongiicola TaxID=1690221 RepID=A0ABN5KDR7_9ACTN|nr:hypothetical protein [Streptomyces spongiicola]AWK08688.1 hypothetical protein DDQ41_06840 [Streptomyces spongiicola]
MNHNTPLSPRPLSDLSDVRRRVLSAAQLRARGVTAGHTAERCGPGGPWQQILPGVFLLHPGTPTGEERLHAAVTYAGRPGRSEAVVTGPAALALHRFASAPSPTALERIDVLVPHTRRLRSVGCARLIRTQALPGPEVVTGLPVAPAARALADAVARLSDPAPVRRLLIEAVRAGHCEPGAVVAELTRARLLSRPHVVDAVDRLLAEGRAVAEGRLYDLVRMYGVPEPVWNVDLRLPGGPHLGGVDAYWPDEAVAVELGTRAPRSAAAHHGPDADPGWPASGRRHEQLERLGITVVQIAPTSLRDAPVQQAMVLRTALLASPDREPAPYVVVLPR